MNVNRYNERKWSVTKKERSRLYPKENITDTDYAVTYLGSNISSTESNVIIRLGMACSGIRMLLRSYGNLISL